MKSSITEAVEPRPASEAGEPGVSRPASRPGSGRIIARLGSGDSGPTLVCIGSMHGNEPAGTLGLERVAAELRRRNSPVRGEFVALVGNRAALEQRVRFVDEDLNRAWSAARIAELHAGRRAASAEETELLDLWSEVAAAVERARGEVWLLDLHTTSGQGPPFGVLDDTLANRVFARMFEVPFVVGLEEELDGTLLSYYVARGMRTFGLESGQHDDPESVRRAEAAIWIALERTGLVEPEEIPERESWAGLLRGTTRSLPEVVEVRYRHPVRPGDGFHMEPGFVNFQKVRAGQVVARDRDGEIRVPQPGRLLMPLYQRQGEDGFFVVREVRPLWMSLSALLRRLRADRLVHWLPGVRRMPGSSDSFVVNRHVARWFALELLHLLGFRRHGRSGRYLVVSRRPRNN